jgi:signal transduction histidine kinase
MTDVENYKNINSVNQNITVQVITFSVVIIVIIITFLSFIHIYLDKKEKVTREIKTEASHLETIITDHLSYSKYFINILARNIQRDHKNLAHIFNTLKDNYKAQDFNILFGWRKYSWVNEDFMEVVNNIDGITKKPRKIVYIEDIIKNRIYNNVYWKNQIVFYNKQKIGPKNSLKIIDYVFDKASKKYIGSVVLSYDISTMMHNLNIRKKNKSINFVILDKNLEIVTQSKPFIQNLNNQDSELVEHLYSSLKNLSKSTSYCTSSNFSYLDMINGLNYYVIPLKDLPFIMIVNLDNELIKREIFIDLIKNFILALFFASLSLFGIIFIYKRETFLRTKAEKASLIAQAATKAKTDFLAFTAHEIRSPLGFILTGSEIMTKEIIGKIPTEYKKYAQGIHENSKVILDFITDILDENQIIEGKFKIINKPYSVESILKEVCQVNLARFNKRKVEIKYFIPDNLPLLICDKRRLVQILSNLVSNSIKYSADDTTIKIIANISHNEMVLVVKDQGYGMKQHEVEMILNANSTLRKSQDYHSSNSYGLGLAIVKMLLDAHNAKLSIVSAPNKGTTVKMLFPKNRLVYSKENGSSS